MLVLSKLIKRAKFVTLPYGNFYIMILIVTRLGNVRSGGNFIMQPRPPERSTANQ